MRKKQRISVTYFCEQFGVTEQCVKNRAKSIYNKPYYHLSEAEKIELLSIFVYDYNKEMPRITLKNIATVSMNMAYIALTCKMMQMQESMKQGLLHEIDDIISKDDLHKLLTILFTERFGKTIEEEFKDTFRPELLMFPNDFLTKKKMELQNDQLDGEPDTGT